GERRDEEDDESERLRDDGKVGGDISLETLYYIDAGERKSAHFPRLVGFVNPIDREFFSVLTHVSGLGVKKVLKSLVMPIRDIATAIENKDAAQLNRLPGIGARLANKIIAELHGKVAKFALSKEDQALSKAAEPVEPLGEEARAVLLQLGYSRSEADRMVEGALKHGLKAARVEDLITVIFRNEQQKKAAE
ncbi:MAG TPA: helix-hairpin-helix domain-containing protein, partial [candidate division Zixibacteria bacterium]|nr:helix-hairpin-helix domain-containing protein [candidate division Zixibacteria bacterium]